MNKKCLSCIHCEVCSFIDSDTAKLEACDFYTKGCEDDISRQAVLDQTYLWSKDEFLRVTNPFDYLRKRINSLPSVKPQEPKWIPVSERLPKISGWYLVTGSRGAISVRYWRKAIPQQGGSYWRGSVNLIAWMPLPEPYKAESEGQ